MTTIESSDYLDPAGVAELLGVSVATVHSYKHRGLLPEPDHRFGQSPAWRRETIAAWKESRPGQGKGGGRKPKQAAS